MIKHFLKIALLIFSLNGSSQDLSIMTYNIRLDVESDGENAWSQRKEFLVSQLKFYAPDVFGIQEGLPHQVSFIDEQLQNYSFVGEGRKGGNNGEYSALYYNNAKLVIKEQGTFWLSLKPKEFSIGWDAALPRICTYALLEQKKSGLKFWVFNTHFDHIGEKARERSAELILRKITELNTENLPVILMGDFNSEPKSIPISMIKNAMDDSKDVSIEESFGPEGTFNAFQFDTISSKRIDYIFVSKSGAIQVGKHAVLNNSKDLRYPSDHFPVYVEISIKNNQ